MRTVYGLQHRTSRRWMTSRPSEGRFGDSPLEADALVLPWMFEAEMEHMALGEFAGAWHIVAITRPIPTTEDY